MDKTGSHFAKNSNQIVYYSENFFFPFGKIESRDRASSYFYSVPFYPRAEDYLAWEARWKVDSSKFTFG